MKFVGNKFNRKIPATPGNVFWLLYFLENKKQGKLSCNGAHPRIGRAFSNNIKRRCWICAFLLNLDAIKKNRKFIPITYIYWVTYWKQHLNISILAVLPDLFPILMRTNKTVGPSVFTGAGGLNFISASNLVGIEMWW